MPIERGRVLVVEDDEDLRFATRLTLDAEGWSVAEASDGAACLAAIGPVDPDVVLLDLGLPDVDGMSVLAMLKGSEQTSWVPVVVLSGRSDPSGVSRLLLAGAQDYLVKPFMGGELHARLVAARRVAVQHRQMAASERRWRVAFDSAPVPMAEVDVDGRYLKVNGAMCELFGYEESDLVGTPVRSICHPDDVDEIGLLIGAMVAGEIHVVRRERRFAHADGHEVWVAVSVAPVIGEGERVSHMLAQYLDISDRKLFEQRLEDLVDRDPLTGLLNRRGFDAELDRQVNHISRYGPVGAVLVIDLDHFKEVNDSLGHEAGDEVLRSVADHLRGSVRHTDVVARIGGDEFAIILPHASAADAESVAAKIVTTLPSRQTALLARLVTASVGVAPFGPALTGQEVLSGADHAMYEAKKSGRDRFATASVERSRWSY